LQTLHNVVGTTAVPVRSKTSQIKQLAAVQALQVAAVLTVFTLETNKVEQPPAPAIQPVAVHYLQPAAQAVQVVPAEL